MQAAVLREVGIPGFERGYSEPVAGPDQNVVQVEASSLNPVDLVKASGTFYLGPPQLPSVVGDEGVGRTEGGKRVYFGASVAPFGSMAERCVVRSADVVELPEGVSSELAAAVGNAGIAAWLALEDKAHLQSGERVLVLGATGAVGQIGVQVARVLGAKQVVAAGRDPKTLSSLKSLGADVTVSLADSDLDAAFSGVEGIDVVLDLVWGPSVLAGLKAANPGVRWIQVGHSAAPEVGLPAPLLRSKRATIIGHANASTPFAIRADAYSKLIQHVARGEVTVPIERVPLSDVSSAWERQRAGSPHAKIVFVPN